MTIDVVDTGIGIPADRLEAVFEPFTQAESSTTRRFGGTGLGLTISRRFARGLGGDIVARSEIGKGSVFAVTLDPGPLDGVRMLSPEEATARAAEAADGYRCSLGVPARQGSGGGRWRGQSRAGPIGAGGGGAAASRMQKTVKLAMDMALEERFDVILMDMQMPVMDGFTATRALRQRGLKIPIIALTANAMKGFEQEVLEAGCTGYLTKPVDIDGLLQTLADLLGGRRATRGAAEEERRRCRYRP